MRPNFEPHPAWSAWLRIFVVQGLLALVVMLPVTIIASTIGATGSSQPDQLLSYGQMLWWVVCEYAGLAIWVAGFVCEAAGDYQLRRFLADKHNEGKLMTEGLWRYTRHPNYFGEVTQWWGIGLIGLSVSWGWLGLVGPLTITSLIVFVSGVPLLEKGYAGRADWERYKKQTSRLVPWWPRRV
jgi:steroid 5-alpha reductase family enzyme